MVHRILVTGGAGFIGSHLVRRLLEENYHVVIVTRDKLHTPRIQSNQPNLVIYDTKDPISLILKEEKIEAVIHCAMVYKKQHTPEDVPKMVAVNIGMPSALLEAMHEHNIKYFINTGTFFEYALSDEPLTEISSQEPYNFYAATKKAFSQILQHYASQSKIKAVDLVLGPPYGPKDNPKLIVSMIKHLLSGESFEISKGGQQWNWTFVNDIVDAYLKALKLLPTLEKNYERINIGAETPLSLRQMVAILEKISGKKEIIKCVKPYNPQEIMYINYDASKAKELLGWKAKTLIEEGLQQTYDYYAKRKGENHD